LWPSLFDHQSKSKNSGLGFFGEGFCETFNPVPVPNLNIILSAAIAVAVDDVGTYNCLT
jgi:hypothetical protein